MSEWGGGGVPALAPFRKQKTKKTKQEVKDGPVSTMQRLLGRSPSARRHTLEMNRGKRKARPLVSQLTWARASSPREPGTSVGVPVGVVDGVPYSDGDRPAEQTVLEGARVGVTPWFEASDPQQDYCHPEMVNRCENVFLFFFFIFFCLSF